MSLTWAIVLSGAFLGSWLLTGIMHHYALVRGLLDMPNQRSSHVLPTPRGGGVAIVVAFLSVLLFLWAHGWMPESTFIAYFGAGIWISFVGFLDDHRHIAARWRLLAHFMGAAWLLGCFGKLPALSVFGSDVIANGIVSLLAATYLVWLLNLYNFMDGIDGIASIEALTVCLGASIIMFVTVSTSLIWVVPLVMAAAAGGFLVWNYPPAKIFMGDAGSGFLGIMLGAMSLEASKVTPQLFWSWLVLLGVFVVDATVTLMRRVFNGKRFYEAHRTHAYQHAAQSFKSHKTVSLAVGAINILWLFPLAAAVALGRLGGGIGLSLAYAPLIVLAVYFKAGKEASA